MKNIVLLFSMLFTMILTSQEKRKVITGQVNFNHAVISDVHVVNKNSNQGTITNNLGIFEILVFVGDTLEFSHINLKKQDILMTKSFMNQRKIEINLQEKTYALNEISLAKPRSILYLDPEIMPPPTVNARTLNLPYANSNAKKDHSILNITSGAVINLDNLINAINGTNKRRKKLQKIALEDSKLSKIRKQYTDDFFITDLHIKQENINIFLNYCVKKNIVSAFNKKNSLKLTKILLDESKTFVQNGNNKLTTILEN
jgi:hypothetical protein